MNWQENKKNNLSKLVSRISENVSIIVPTSERSEHENIVVFLLTEKMFSEEKKEKKN